MFRRIFASGLLAGLLAGLFVAVLQQATTVPLIQFAETFEQGGEADTAAHAHDHGEKPHDHGDSHDHAGNGHDHGEGWMPEDGIERIFYTALSSVVIGCGWALMLVALVAISGRRLDARSGILWGAAGFVATALAPAVGLPPELPGSMAAEVDARILWWIGTVVASAIALWLMVFTPGRIATAAGIVLLALPHIIGAPQPDHFGGPVPPELSAQFVAVSLALAAVFWTVLGWLAGMFWTRFGQEA
ncbi:MAG: CbtA family protein [Pseudomonadota bacterium]|nr:CbtA family protein [Pseudomonadota bacterium]